MTTGVYSNVRKLYSHLLEIFEEGSKTGELKPELNPRLALDIFVGTMDHIVTRWLLKDMSYSIFENLDHLFELMIGAFAAGPSRESAPPEAPDAVATAGTVEMHSAGVSS